VEYVLLLYCDESNIIDHRPDEEREAFYAEFREFNKALSDAGAFLSAKRLETSDTATTLRLENGRAVTTDGPFAETKEHLAGLFVIECEDLDAALGWAKRIPHAQLGPVEVRPVNY
jgi:hypothetical protein